MIERPTTSAIRHHAWWIYLAAGSVVCALYVFVSPLKGSGPVINGLGLSGVLAVVAGIRMYQPSARGAWWLFVAGLLLFWLGDIYTYSYPKLFGADVPFPSPGDGLYIAVYPVLMAGLLILVRRRNKRADGPGLIDALIMTLGLGLVSYVLLIAPYVHDQTLTLLPKLVSIAYPIADIILLAAAIRLAVDAGSRRPSFYLLIASIGTVFTTDFAYGIVTLNGSYHHQLSLDVGWIFFYLLWGSAALHPSMKELSDPAPGRERRFTPFRLVLLAGATLVAPVLEIVKAPSRAGSDMIVMIAASIALFALVVGRMWGLVRQREKSVGRERALTAAGGALVGATSPQQTATAGLRAVAELAGSGREVRLCRVSDEIRVSALVDGELTRWPAGAELAQAMRARNAADMATLDEDVRAVLRLASDHRTALMISVPMAEGAELLVVVGGKSATAGETQYALRSLAQQIALALETAALSEQVHRRASEARFASLVQNSTDLITVLGRRHRPLSEPVDRGRPRLRRRRGHRAVVRLAAASLRARSAADTPHRGGSRRSQPSRADRMPARPPRRQPAPLRDPAHQPARRSRGRRHRAQRPRRLRAQGVRGATCPPGIP